MNRIWRYVLATDAGMAPCVDNNMLTLSCCKPMIRKHAIPGDWVIAVAPKQCGIGRVAYVGHISEILSLGEYERRFRGRRDAIYRAKPGAMGEELVALRKDYHEDERSRARDRGGKNALIFDPFWYWGGTGIPARGEIADLAHYFVGQTTKRSTDETIAQLKEWVHMVSKPGIHGRPRTPLRRKLC